MLVSREPTTITMKKNKTDQAKKPLVVILGNHMVNSERVISFDAKSLSLFGQYPEADLVCAIDNVKISVPELCSNNYSKQGIIKSRAILKADIQSQLPGYIQSVIFESSLRTQADKHHEDFCSISPMLYKVSKEDIHVCTCWGLIVVLANILWAYYEKVIFVTSGESTQLKVEDALKAKVFFSDRDDFELFFAK